MLINTLASYLRIIANGVVSIIVTRIALNALGVEDYGLYNLMAGTIALLSFVNSALLISSQRYFSIAIGKKDISLLQKYFSGSIVIHSIFSIIIILVLLSLQPILFNYVLNINSGQVHVAVYIYQIMIISTCVTMNCVPFAAMMNAYEDIAALSYINIGSYVIRLLAALSLLLFKDNLLIIFSLIIMLSILFKLFGEIIWCKIKYKNINLNPHNYIDKNVCKEMTGFASWNTLGSFSVLIRDEGVAIMLNSFFGTAINAAYGIANQVNSLVLSFASNLTTVFAPSIIQAKGEGNDDRMKYLAVFSSKMSLILSCAIGLPILIFLEPILQIWLKEIPSYTIVFCKYIVICFLIQQIYPGINRMIYATGRIKNYQIGIFILFAGIIPFGIMLFKHGFTPTSIFYVMMTSQLAAMLWSLYLGNKLCGLDIKSIIVHSVLIPIILFVVLYHLYYTCIIELIVNYSIIMIFLGSIMALSIYLPLAYVLILDKKEKEMIVGMIKNHTNKYFKKKQCQ